MSEYNKYNTLESFFVVIMIIDALLTLFYRIYTLMYSLPSNSNLLYISILVIVIAMIGFWYCNSKAEELQWHYDINGKLQKRRINVYD